MMDMGMLSQLMEMLTGWLTSMFPGMPMMM